MRRPVLAAAAALACLAGLALTRDDAPTRTVRVGAATVVLSGDWHPLAGHPTTLTDGRERVTLAFGPPAGASLVPAALTSGAAQLDGARVAAPVRAPAPRPTRLAGYSAWTYADGVTVLPTTRGTLGLRCAEPGCAKAVVSASVAGAAVLAPTGDLALRLRAPAVLGDLDETRVAARADLGRGPVRRPAQVLAAAHRTALTALGPVASSELSAALSGAAAAYETLAGASSSAAARAGVLAADRAVEDVTAALAREGTPAVQPAPAARAASTGGGSPATWLFVLALALVAAVLAPVGWADRLRARPARRLPADRRPAVAVAVAPATHARPCPVPAVLRRAPIVPPPTYGRWDEEPRGPAAGAAAEGGDAREDAMASSSTA